jgi:hypothetical protein
MASALLKSDEKPAAVQTKKENKNQRAKELQGNKNGGHGRIARRRIRATS